MLPASPKQSTRRDFLFVATGAAITVGFAATFVPLIAQMNPDASTIAAGAPVEVDLTPIAEANHQGVLAQQTNFYLSPRAERHPTSQGN